MKKVLPYSYNEYLSELSLSRYSKQYKEYVEKYNIGHLDISEPLPEGVPRFKQAEVDRMIARWNEENK